MKKQQGIFYSSTKQPWDQRKKAPAITKGDSALKALRREPTTHYYRIVFPGIIEPQAKALELSLLVS